MSTEAQKYKVLIVEDGIFNQQVLRNALSDFYDIRVVGTGVEVMPAVREFKPYLVLLDIVLPDINGFQILSELKYFDDTRDIPVIIITGLEDDANEEKGLFLGAVDYIRKPFNISILRARIRTHIQIVKQIQTIERMCYIDALTEVPNRRKFDFQMEYEWNRTVRLQTPISLLMMDLDKFKNYNDTYGHAQGDVMLQSVGRTMQASLLRSTDMVFRLGGEEFTALLPGTDSASAVEIAERIRAEVAKMQVPDENTGTPTNITISIGAATQIPAPGCTPTALIETADKMLYVAKKNGRNQVQASILEPGQDI